MAELEEGFELCKIAPGVELLGAEKHCDEDKIILTFKNRESLVYNVRFYPLLFSQGWKF